MIRTSVVFLGTCIALSHLLMSVSASAAVITVDGKDNIFGAGHATAPPGGANGGNLPTSFSFSAGAGQVLTFSSVTGSVKPAGSLALNGPDGDPTTGFFDTNISSFGGISGIKFDDNYMFLVGVFLDNSEPTDPAPSVLDFSSTGITSGFTALSPVLNQTFFVGDGLTGTGTGSVQNFNVPATATRLFLGFPDGVAFQGVPTAYKDNSGSLTATFNISSSSGAASVPEPSSLLLGLCALGIFGAAERRKRRQHDQRDGATEGQ